MKKKPKFKDVTFFELFPEIFPEEAKRIKRKQMEERRHQRLLRGDKREEEWIEFDDTKRPMKPRDKTQRFKDNTDSGYIRT